jgi:cellulose synthase/poly-beta-1,6-N-acetylglucosamine synthase-like glycosyltransferase
VIGLLQILFWASLAALVWTHLGYPLFVAAWSRLRPWPVAKADVLPTVSLIIPAYNEQDVIEAKLENTLQLLFNESNLLPLCLDLLGQSADLLLELGRALSQLRLLPVPRL